MATIPPATVFLGVDEAGYGPLLGPLVTAGCAVRVEAGVGGSPGDLWQALKPWVQRPRKTLTRRSRPGRRIYIGDSKRIYTPALGCRELERSVLTLFAWVRGRELRSSAGIDELLVGDPLGSPEDEGFADPWHQLGAGPFPLAPQARFPLPPPPRVPGVEPLLFGARVLGARTLNRRFESLPNKAEVAWESVAVFLRRGWALGEHGPVVATIDRQGGRKHYAAALQSVFPGAFIWTLEEGGRRSSYRVQQGGRTLEVSFRVGADREAWTTAAASMLAKYLRELAMDRFNRFFVEHGSAAEPTAGYYTDGRRFLEQTAALRQSLGIADRELIRAR